MIRGSSLRLFCALAGAAAAYPAIAKDPKPTLFIDRIAAHNLLAPLEDEGAPLPRYRIDPSGGAAIGTRARLSIPVAGSTLFAITGKLTRRAEPVGPIDQRHARVLGQRRSDGGKVYGAGFERSLGGIDFGNSYQYSKLRAEEPQLEGANTGGLGRSHSMRATARVRFRP